LPRTKNDPDPIDRAASAARAVNAEIEGLRALAAALADGLRGPFEAAAGLIAQAPGRVVVTGIGKSGHIARKIAATLASTGTPAFFLHPAEASHGDLGMVAQGDVVLALSLSGETPELRDVIHYCKRFAAPLIAVTSEAASALAGAADIALILPRAEEACSIRLAPTTSTTMQLAFGDALAVALSEARGFSAADFKTYHPGGRLGAQLVTVADLMGKGQEAPAVADTASLSEAIVEISQKGYGGAAVVDAEGRLVGAFTDRDLRRALASDDLSACVADHMTRTPVFVAPHVLATEAMRVMNERRILVIFVCDGERLVGAVHMHDLLRAGIA
jgi:arabinose-5-phosphate isomerase